MTGDSHKTPVREMSDCGGQGGRISPDKVHTRNRRNSLAADSFSGGHEQINALLSS